MSILENIKDMNCSICYQNDDVFYGFVECVSRHLFCMNCMLQIHFSNPTKYRCPVDTMETENVYQLINGEIKLRNENWFLAQYMLTQRAIGNDIFPRIIKIRKTLDRLLSKYEKLLQLKIGDLEKRYPTENALLNWEYSMVGNGSERFMGIINNFENKRTSWNGLLLKDSESAIYYPNRDENLYLLIDRHIKYVVSNYERRAMEKSLKIHAISQGYFRINEFNRIFSSLKNVQYTNCFVCFRRVVESCHAEFDLCHHKLCIVCFRQIDRDNLICPLDFCGSEIEIFNENIDEIISIEEIIATQKHQILSFYNHDTDYVQNKVKNALPFSHKPYVKERDDEGFYETLKHQLNDFSNKYHENLSTNKVMMRTFLTNIEILHSFHYRQWLLSNFDFEDKFIFCFNEAEWTMGQVFPNQ